MAVLRPRTRLVYFRISEDEFRDFNVICEREGARSISDLARQAVRKMLQESKISPEPQSLTELRPLLLELNSRLSTLVKQHES